MALVPRSLGPVSHGTCAPVKRRIAAARRAFTDAQAASGEAIQYSHAPTAMARRSRAERRRR
jgi:hypothetical protein